MTLGDLEFKAIDFQGVCGALGIRLGTDLTPLADHVNRLLRERLEKAPKFWCNLWGETRVPWNISSIEKPTDRTHTFLAVCVEEIMPSDTKKSDPRP
jgi:hypothetical protein